MAELSEFERGFLTGLLVGEGSFGGDGKQPQIVLRMHTRHERIFRWLEARFPACRLYGPYHHGGRDYFQWMARGRALVDELLPLLDLDEIAVLDEPAADRLRDMCARYADVIAAQQRRSALAALAAAADRGVADGD
jgi:hypothetical protein